VSRKRALIATAIGSLVIGIVLLAPRLRSRRAAT
jgi:hypothetical protein